MGKENLIQFSGKSSTPEQRRAIARKAGLASGVARQQRQKLRETLSTMMTSTVTEPELLEALEAAGWPADHQHAIALAAVVRAERGDIEAARFVRDTLGEKPTEALQMSLTDKPIQAMDLSKLSDEELVALADGLDFDEDRAALPER